MGSSRREAPSGDRSRPGPYHLGIHTLIEQNGPALADLCRRHQVRVLDLFGSATGSDFDAETSDLDFLVEFEDLEPIAYSTAFFGLLDDLNALFGRPVDLVDDSSIRNPYFQESVERTRTALFAA